MGFCPHYSLSCRRTTGTACLADHGANATFTDMCVSFFRVRQY